MARQSTPPIKPARAAAPIPEPANRAVRVPAARPGRETLRDRLRRATSPSHQRLDAAFAGLDLRRRPDYERFLLVNARVVPALESALEQGGVERLLPDWPRRRRTEALHHDLERLCLAAPAVEPPSSAPGTTSGLAQLGIAYALEGSRLGARLLLRAVEASPDAAVRAASAFLRHGTTSGLWRSFLEQLNRHPGAGRGAAEVEAGARAVFDAYLAALSDTSAGRA